MNSCAAADTAVRPTDGLPPLIVSDPCAEKNEATRCGSWLHHAAVYRVANALTLVSFIGLTVDAQPTSMNSDSAVSVTEWGAPRFMRVIIFTLCRDEEGSSAGQVRAEVVDPYRLWIVEQKVRRGEHALED